MTAKERAKSNYLNPPAAHECENKYFIFSSLRLKIAFASDFRWGGDGEKLHFPLINFGDCFLVGIFHWQKHHRPIACVESDRAWARSVAIQFVVVYNILNFIWSSAATFMIQVCFLLRSPKSWMKSTVSNRDRRRFVPVNSRLSHSIHHE